jgi:exopolysaccharide production protein ExoQ
MNRGVQAIAHDWPGRRAGVQHWPFNRSLIELSSDAACIAFILAISTSARLPSIDDLNRAAWLLADVTTVAMIATWHAQFIETARKNLILLSWPALATMSSLWSLTPEMSQYHGLQLLATVLVGFLLSIFARLDRLVALVFTAFFGSAVLSAAFVVVNPGSGIAAGGEWQGIYAHKNLMGSMMGLLIIAAACLFLEGWYRWLSGGAMLFAAMLLLLSRSGTAIVVLALTLAAFPVSMIVRKGMIAAWMAAGFALMTGAAGLLVLELNDVDLMQFVLRALGKDETLTGRTLLWDIAINAYESRPWSGFGFKAWWAAEETGAPFVKYIIGSEAGSFHNTFLEVAVALGHVGLFLLVLGLLASFIVALRAYFLDGRPTSLWPLLTVVYIAFTCSAETMLFANHSMFQLLLVVAAASATRHISLHRSEQGRSAG